jgi:hypothetical protein
MVARGLYTRRGYRLSEHRSHRRHGLPSSCSVPNMSKQRRIRGRAFLSAKFNPGRAGRRRAEEEVLRLVVASVRYSVRFLGSQFHFEIPRGQ